MLHILGVDASNRYSSILRCIYPVLRMISQIHVMIQVKPTSFANSCICFGVKPVYANIPIYVHQQCSVSRNSGSGTCEVMWLQSRGLPASLRFLMSKALISIMRSAIPLTSPSHCLLRAGSSRIAAAIRAPWMGGFEYIGRTKILICDSTRFVSSGEPHTIENAPTRSP